MRKIALLFFIFLSACSGSGNTLPSTQTGIISILRYNPTNLTGSLSQPRLVFGYVDAGRHNGEFPLGSDLRSAFDILNPNIQNGICSKNATISIGTISVTDLNPGQGPSVVIAFYPKSLGTCTQTFPIPGGADATISYTVNP